MAPFEAYLGCFDTLEIETVCLILGCSELYVHPKTGPNPVKTEPPPPKKKKKVTLDHLGYPDQALA